MDTQKMEVWLPMQGKLAAPEERSGSGMLLKGAAILSGPAATCMLCKQARAVLSPENDRSVREMHYMIRLNEGFRSDLRWCFQHGMGWG